MYTYTHARTLINMIIYTVNMMMIAGARSRSRDLMTQAAARGGAAITIATPQKLSSSSTSDTEPLSGLSAVAPTLTSTFARKYLNCVCVYYCSTYYKAVCVWGGG